MKPFTFGVNMAMSEREFVHMQNYPLSKYAQSK